MIKLIATDIDGTLVEDGGSSMNPELYDVILKLREKGIQIAAASGRQWVSIEKLFDPVKKKIFYISDGGAYVGCCGRNLFLYPLEKGLAKELIQDIRDTGELEVMVSGPDVIYTETKNREFVRWLETGYRFRVKQVEDVSAIDDQIIKISAYRDKDVQGAAAHLLEKYKGRLKMAAAGEMWLDSTLPDANKGTAVRMLQESLGIRPEETMVFGDQLNDIDMLNQAYYSFAIGNARKEVKEAARFEADTNLKDGVLKVLKLLL